MAVTKVIKYVSKDEYMEYAANTDFYKDEFTFRGDIDSIHDLISNKIAHYTNKYGQSEIMRYALVEYVFNRETREFMCFGFDDTDKDGNEDFYCCC